MPPGAKPNDEERPLLHPDGDASISSLRSQEESQQVRFESNDPRNPKSWSPRARLLNVGIIALMAILSPLASSMFTPGISQIAKDLDTDEQSVITTTTGFVIMLGFGPLVFAPCSETFGRRSLYIACFSVFTPLQAASALSPGIQSLIVLRTVRGFLWQCGSREWRWHDQRYV